MHLEQNAADEYENEDGEDGRSMIDVAKMHAWAIDATTMAVNPRFYIQDPPPFFYIQEPHFLYTRPPFL